ncbi:coiled-coil domain-containing protein 40-like [Uloborus diversus]|uniref:coiled-coil domain-containing protein 40-like n=1 Tax=Uloborus diversus TaxID=327109 RepID=UPI00240A2FEF|nr:coiled-coil domain-containing protein 40-like [Uloborus diversus]
MQEIEENNKLVSNADMENKNELEEDSKGMTNAGEEIKNQDMLMSDENADVSSNDNSDSTSKAPLTKDTSKSVRKKVLDPSHPLMIKYQKDLRERLLSLLQETDEQIIELNRTVNAQMRESSQLKTKSYVLQKEVKLEEEKLQKCCVKYEEQTQKKQQLLLKCENIRKDVVTTEEKRTDERKKDTELQARLEDLAFEVVQLTSLRMETLTDAKNLKRAVEKTTKDKEQLELQKLRQDLLISRLENDKYNLEDKINLYKRQWAIKKEEINDLRRELEAANMEMQTINFEKQQIVSQWRQSLASLEKHDRILSEIRSSVSTFEDTLQTLNTDITVQKKAVRKELERNESLTSQLRFRESDIASVRKDLSNSDERSNQMEENLSLVEKIIEITQNELNFSNDKKMSLEKELESRERLIVRAWQLQKQLEKKQMDIIHDKITLTKASKNTERLIGEQSTLKHGENDMYKKKQVIMGRKKVQLEADVVKEEKCIKEIEKKKQSVEKELYHINKLLHQKKEFQEALKQSSDLSRDDFVKTLKEKEMHYLQKQSELGYFRKKKRKHFRKLIDIQTEILNWEGKVHLAEETRRVLKSKANLEDFSNLKSEIRRFNVKLDQIKREQESLVKQMSKAVYRHTALFIEADKQALFGRRRKTPDYVQTRIKSNLKKLHENKKILEGFRKERDSLATAETRLNDAIDAENQTTLDFMNKISSYENNTDRKQREKRQAVLQLSFKQKRTKLLQKVLDNTYIRAVRNETQRPTEIQKVQNALRTIHVISQAAMNEYHELTKELGKIIDYIFVSKYI